jgi:hypothetical protein
MLSAMADRSRLEIIKQNPIGKGLEGFRALYGSVCNSKSIPCASDTLDQLDDEGLASCFVVYPPLTVVQISGNSFTPFCERRKTSPLPTCFLPRHIAASFEAIFCGLNSHSTWTTSTSTVSSLS